MQPQTELFQAHYQTALGAIEMKCSERGVRELRALDIIPEVFAPLSHSILELCAQQLDEYFEGERQSFSVPLDARATEWQARVWQALHEIPYGTTATYGEIARNLGAPNASRAVGAANGRNPIWILVPCHRVVGASGALVGYAGGIARKMQLLDLERKYSGGSLF